MDVDLISEHASPLAAIGGVDAGGQNVHVAALAAGRPRGHVRDVVTVGGGHPVGLVGVLPARVHGDLVPAGGQAGRQRRDVHVLPAGVHSADGGERAGVLADQVDPHRVTSVRSASQSPRKRARP